jgi:hypothetical protein
MELTRWRCLHIALAVLTTLPSRTGSVDRIPDQFLEVLIFRRSSSGSGFGVAPTVSACKSGSVLRWLGSPWHGK